MGRGKRKERKTRSVGRKKYIKTTIVVRRETWEELKMMSIKLGMNLGQIVEFLLERWKRRKKFVPEDELF